MKRSEDINYKRDPRYDMHGNLLYNYVTKNDMDNYKTRLANALLKDGIDCDMVNDDALTKQFISNWANDNIISKNTQNRIMGITYKFSYLDLDKHSKTEESERRTFPIINKYNGHNLIDTTYFAVDGETLSSKVIPLNNLIVTL